MQFYQEKRKGYGFWIFWILSIVLATLHFSTLNLAPTYTYDQVRNMQIVLQISEGDFSSVLHHISPAFYLIFGFLYRCGLGFEELRMINLLFGLGSVALVAAWWARRTLPLWAACAGMLLICLSVVFSFNIRIFSIEAGSLAFAGLMICALSVYKPVRAALAAGLGFLYNYKILLLFFPFALIWIAFNYKRIHLKTGLRAALAFVSPILLVWIGSMALGLPVLQYPKKIWAIMFLKNVNPENQSSGFQSDFLYYFKYLWHFETALACFVGVVLVCALLLLVTRNQIMLSKNSRFWFLGALIYMCLAMWLQKAPRALLPFLPLLVFPVMELASKSVRLLRLIILISLIPVFVFQLRASWKNAMGLTQDNYPRLAHFLDNNKIDTVYTMASLGIWPAAHQENIQIKACLQSQYLPKSGVWYLLDDGYSRAAGLNFALPERKQLLVEYPNPVYALPMLFFEHSEFANESYAQTWHRYQTKGEQAGKIRLYKVTMP